MGLPGKNCYGMLLQDYFYSPACHPTNTEEMVNRLIAKNFPQIYVI